MNPYTVPIPKIPSVALEQCPLCDSPITRKQFVEVESRIREQEQRKLEEQRRSLEAHQRKLDEQYRVKTEAFRIETQNKAKAEADARVLAMTQERDAAVARAKNVQEHAQEQTKKMVADAEIKVRDEMAKDYEKKHLARVAEEARKLEAAQKAKAEADARVLTITRERDAAVVQAKNVQEQTQEQTKKAVADAVTAAREALARDNEKKDLARAAEAARERESLQKKISDLQRQIANKTANALGDDAEIDLFEMLRDVFTDDRITRIQKGERGADIKHEVRYKGVVAGMILFDSKNRKAWQGMFASKLKEDQVAANADHAILSTTAFPAGKKELCVDCDVIVARPGRVRELVQILRVEIIKAHVAGLTNQKRAEKREALYQFISSETYRQKTAEVTRLTDEILGVDVSEKEQHDRTWKKRGSLVRQLQRAETAIDTEISAIVEGKSP